MRVGVIVSGGWRGVAAATVGRAAPSSNRTRWRSPDGRRASPSPTLLRESLNSRVRIFSWSRRAAPSSTLLREGLNSRVRILSWSRRASPSSNRRPGTSVGRRGAARAPRGWGATASEGARARRRGTAREERPPPSFSPPPRPPRRWLTGLGRAVGVVCVCVGGGGWEVPATREQGRGRGAARVAGRRRAATPAGSRVAETGAGPLLESKSRRARRKAWLEPSPLSRR